MTDNDIEAISKKVKIERVYPDDLRSHFVSSILVQHQPDFFILSFFELWPPAILGESNEEEKAALEAVDHVDAKCVARLVVTPDKMRDFVEAMSRNLANYEAMMRLRLDLNQDE